MVVRRKTSATDQLRFKSFASECYGPSSRFISTSYRLERHPKSRTRVQLKVGARLRPLSGMSLPS